MRAKIHTWKEVEGQLREGKECSSCKMWLPLAAFHKCSVTHDKLQLVCKGCTAAKHKETHDRFPHLRKEQNRKSVARYGPEYYRTQQQRLKRLVIDAYGGKCECCGETEIAFLSLDHVSGGGHKHRKLLGGGTKLWRTLRDAGWPKELPEVGRFRVLCMNCQFGYLHGRTCPHELKRQAAMVCVDPDTPS